MFGGSQVQKPYHASMNGFDADPGIISSYINTPAQMPLVAPSATAIDLP